LPTIKKSGAVVLGISPDKPETLLKWQSNKGLPFDLLSDPNHEVLAAYGAWGKKKLYGKVYEGVIRSYFVIDEKGKIAAFQVKVSPLVSVEEAVAFLQG
jgi:peroxiredoxin Q/BCP